MKMKIYTETNLINNFTAVYINFEREKGNFGIQAEGGLIVSVQGTNQVDVSKDKMLFIKERATRNYVFIYVPRTTHTINVNGFEITLDAHKSHKKLNAKTVENISHAFVCGLILINKTDNAIFNGTKLLIDYNNELTKDKKLDMLLNEALEKNSVEDLKVYAKTILVEPSSRYPKGLVDLKAAAQDRLSIFQILSLIGYREHSFVIPLIDLYKGVKPEDVKDIPLFTPNNDTASVKLQSVVMGDSNASLSLRFFVDGQVPINSTSAVMNNMPVLLDCDTVITTNIVMNGKYNPDLESLLVITNTNLYNKLASNNPEAFKYVSKFGNNVMFTMVLKEIPLYGDIELDAHRLLEFMIDKRINESRLNILKKFIERYAVYETRKAIRHDGKNPKKKFADPVQRKVLSKHFINHEFMTYTGLEFLKQGKFELDRIQLRGDKMRLPTMEELSNGKFKKGVCPPLRDAGLAFYERYTKKVQNLGQNTKELSEYLLKEYTEVFNNSIRNDLFLLGIKVELLNDETSPLWNLFVDAKDRYVCEVDNYNISLKLPNQLVTV